MCRSWRKTLLESIGILSSACTLLAEKCVDGIEATVEQLPSATARRRWRWRPR